MSRLKEMPYCDGSTLYSTFQPMQNTVRGATLVLERYTWNVGVPPAMYLPQHLQHTNVYYTPPPNTFSQPHLLPSWHQRPVEEKIYTDISEHQAEDKKRRRMEANRESARRSKMRRREREDQIALHTVELLRQRELICTSLREKISEVKNLYEANQELREVLGLEIVQKEEYEVPRMVEIPDIVTKRILKCS